MPWHTLRQAGDRLFPWLLLSALLHMLFLLGVGFRPHPLPEQLPPQAIEVELSPAASQGQPEHAEPSNPADPGESSTSSRPDILPVPSASEPRSSGTEPVSVSTDLTLDLPSGQERFLTADTRNTAQRQYLEVWRQKVERVGNLNYPAEARDRHLHGSLVLDVSLRPDGSLADIVVLRSSGIAMLDAAARRFVEMAAPFDPFPAELRGNTAVLHIIRTLHFRAGEMY